MSLSLSRYLAVLMTALAILVLYQDWQVGLAFCVASAATFLPLYLLRLPKRYFYVQLFLALSLWGGYLTRVPFLVGAPELFRYRLVGQVTPELLIAVLLQYALYATLCFTGIFLAFRSFDPPRTAHATRKIQPLFLRASAVIALVCLLVFTARVFLQLGLGLNTKMVMNPRFGFLSTMVPDQLLYPVCILYLAKYRRRLPQFEAIVFSAIAAGMVTLTLIAGSRQIFVAVGLSLFLYFLIQKGDFKIGLSRMIVVVSVSMSLLLVTFVVAEPIRNFHKSKGGSRQQLLSALWRGVQGLSHAGGEVLFLANEVSHRVTLSMEGMVGVALVRAPLAVETFRPARAAERAVAGLIPRYKPPGNEISSGKSVGMAYSGQALHVRNSGALGLFASLNLTFGKWLSFPATLICGVLFGLYFRLTARARDPDLVYLLHFVGLLMMLSWVLEGNFDELIPNHTARLMLIAVYYCGCGIMVTAASLGSYETEPKAAV